MQRRFEASLPFKAFALFEVFPFSVLLDQELNIVVVGNALRKIIPGCVGEHFCQEQNKSYCVTMFILQASLSVSGSSLSAPWWNSNGTIS